MEPDAPTTPERPEPVFGRRPRRAPPQETKPNYDHLRSYDAANRKRTTSGSTPNGSTSSRDARVALWERREKAAELHAIGKSYELIGTTLGIARSTAHDDVRAWFRESARRYRAAEFRERIATTYQATITMARREFQKLPPGPEWTRDRLACLDRMHKALDGLRAAYGLMGENTFRMEIPIQPAGNEQVAAAAPDWTKDLTREQLHEIRGRILGLYSAMPREAVPAAYRELADAIVVEANGQAEVVPEPVLAEPLDPGAETGSAHVEPDGPATMTGA